MSVDLCFWESGDGSAEELYEDAADGVDHTFVPSSRVLEFRAGLLSRWPDLVDSVEPLKFDPDLQEPADLSRFLLVMLHTSRGGHISEIIGVALAAGLVGYDPQSGMAITA